MGRTGEFHTELELLPESVIASALIQYAINVERAVMEGKNPGVISRPDEAHMNAFQFIISSLAASHRSTGDQRETKNSDSIQTYGLKHCVDGLQKLVSYTGELERIV